MKGAEREGVMANSKRPPIALPLLHNHLITTSLAVDTRCDVIRGSTCRRSRALTCVLSIVLILDLGVRNADTLARYALRSSTRTVTGDVTVGHNDLKIHIGAGIASSFISAQCAGVDVAACVEVLYDLPAGRIQCTGKAEV